MQPTLSHILVRRVRHAIHITGRARNLLIDHCHLYHETYAHHLNDQTHRQNPETRPSLFPLAGCQTTHVRSTRRNHSWYDTDHGTAALDWCHRNNIGTHPQRRKPRGYAPSKPLRQARDCSNRLQYHLFQTCLHSIVGHAYPNFYGHSFKPTASARRRGRRRLLMGQTGSWIRRRQRVQPPSTFCKVAGRSIFEPLPTVTIPPTPIPTPTEIITDLLRTEHVHTTSLLGGLNTWITAPVDDFPDLYPVYVAFVDCSHVGG